MEKEYNVYYRERNSKDAVNFCTTITAKSVKVAGDMAREEFNNESGYTVVSVKLA